MKRNNPPFPFEAPAAADPGRRHPMNFWARTLLILLLALILAATGLAWYAGTHPVIIRLDRQTLVYDRTAAIDYTVNLKQGTFGDSGSLPMDQVYIRDTVASMDISFAYGLHTDRQAVWDVAYRIDAVVQICDREDPDIVYLQQSLSLLDTRELQGLQNIAVTETVTIDLAEYETLAAQYNPDPNLPVSYRLQVRLSLNAATGLLGGPYSLSDQLVMYIPLREPSLLIVRELPAADEVAVRQGVDYQLALTPLPFFVYPATAGLTLVLLVLLLLVTRNRHRSRFQRRLKRRLRRLRRTLILIGNKAWEPEWCVRITNFRSLVRTARKLRLPVFCYIERRLPLAYFYVQIGENNYCYIYSPDPGIDPSQLEMDSEIQSGASDLDEEAIPILPEDDDLDEELVGLEETGADFTGRAADYEPPLPPREKEETEITPDRDQDSDYASDDDDAASEVRESAEPEKPAPEKEKDEDNPYNRKLF